MAYMCLWNKNCNFAPARVLLPLQSKLCKNQKIFYIVLSDIRITRIIMNVSFLWHSLHYLQVAKRLYCARHHTKSQMLHTKNSLDKQVWFAHRDYHFSKGPSTGKTRKKWRGRGQENNDSLKKKKRFWPQMSQHMGRCKG